MLNKKKEQAGAELGQAQNQIGNGKQVVCCCIPVRISSCKAVFLWGCLPVRSLPFNMSSCKVIFLWGYLSVRWYSCEVVCLWILFGRITLRYASYQNDFLHVWVGGCKMKIRLTPSSSTEAVIGLSLVCLLSQGKAKEIKDRFYWLRYLFRRYN